ncbi:MAG: nascent polypeptide-associated complex protein [Candidatus Aenigmarchaeota archaeon]|nr:nascent polypeptide-associated complex protein [Candidatus Aenigmarchaeota archaeon]
MIPNINPKQLEKMARQMGMQVQNIDATEVIIKSPDGDWIIKSPQVTKVCMGSTETFQVMGEVTREDKVKAEDIEILVQKTGISKEKAEELLTETGDLLLAIKRAKE